MKKKLHSLTILYLIMAWSLGSDLKLSLGSESSRISNKKENQATPLTLERALELSLSKSPELAALHFEVLALKGGANQAGLIANPELGLELEHFGGSDSFQDTDAAERTARVSQLFELGGKRPKRKRVALFEVDLAYLDYKTRHLEVIAQVKKDFIDTLSSQEQLVLAKELVRLARQVLKTVAERVKAGKVSPLEETKAKIALSKTLIDLRRAERKLFTVRKRLASNWGAVSPNFKRAQGSLEVVPIHPSYKKLNGLVWRNPDLARWSVETERRQVSLNLERSKRWPDLTLGGGVRYYDETDDHAFLAGISIPLPIFNRNQGTISQAEQRFLKADEERRIVELRILTSLAQAHQELFSALGEVATLKQDVLPGAHQAFEAAGEGYKQGKLGYLDVLDAQRTLFEAKTQYLDALVNYHKAVVDVERLIGGSLDDISRLEKKESKNEA